MYFFPLQVSAQKVVDYQKCKVGKFLLFFA
jgi:hypothetical protein